MSEKKYWISSGMYTMLHRGLDFVLGFLGFIILVRVFPQSTFGSWVLFITITSIVDMARNGFIQNGLIRFLVGEYQQENAHIQTAALWLNAALTALFILLLWMTAPFLETFLNAPSLAEILRLHCLILPVLIFHTHIMVVLQARGMFRAYFWAGIFKSVPFFGFIAVMYILEKPLSLTMLTWAQNIAFILAALTALYQCRDHLFVSKFISGKWLKNVFHFGKYVFGTNLVSMLGNSLDKFLLGALLSPIQVAISNAAGRILNFIEVPVNSVASITYPKASETAQKEDIKRMKYLYERSTGLMLFMTVPFFVIVMIFAKDIILLIAGEEYIESVLFLRIIIVIAILKPFDRQAGVFLDAMGKPDLNFKLVFVTMMATLIFSLILIPTVGLYGAAIAWVSAVSITVAIKQTLMHRALQARMWASFYYAWRFLPEGVGILRSKMGK